MRIAIIAPFCPPAVRDCLDRESARIADDVPGMVNATIVVTLVRALLTRGHQVSVVTTDQAARRPVTLTGSNLRINVFPRRRARQYILDMYRVECAAMRKCLLSERPDVVHAHWTYEYALAALDSHLPTVITAHDAPLRMLVVQKHPVYYFTRLLAALRVLRRARQITVVSPYLAGHFRRAMRFRGDIRVIPNGLPEQVFLMGEREAREGPPRRALTYAAVLGGWGKNKNAVAAIRAFAQLRQAHPTARLLLFGAGHGRDEEAGRWASARRLTAGIEFVGAVPHGELLRRLRAEADVLVHPALEESFCMCLVEALALGIPVIGGRSSGGVPWTLDNGRAGHLVDVRTPTALAGAMRRLADDPELRRSMAALGRASVRRRFHINTVIEQYEQAYHDALAEPAPALDSGS